MEWRNAASVSTEALLLRKDMVYSVTMASHGSLILPSLLAKPNTSCDIRRSSLKTTVLRHANGTSNLLPSVVYMTKWPFPATAVEHPSAAVVVCYAMVFGGHWTKNL